MRSFHSLLIENEALKEEIAKIKAAIPYPYDTYPADYIKGLRSSIEENRIEIAKLSGYIQVLEERIAHLFQSKFIRSFDAKDPKTKEYKRAIADADTIALQIDPDFHYEHALRTPILTGDDARAFSKAFIEYLEKRDEKMWNTWRKNG